MDTSDRAENLPAIAVLAATDIEAPARTNDAHDILLEHTTESKTDSCEPTAVQSSVEMDDPSRTY